jgi:hypothetical protein
MFSNGVGFQIYGGNFYDVQSGDVNLHTHQRLTIQDKTLNPEALQAAPPSSVTLALEDGWEAEGSGRELSGVVRHRRHTSTAGPGPYGAFGLRRCFTPSHICRYGLSPTHLSKKSPVRP